MTDLSFNSYKKSNFSLAFYFLSKEKREALSLIYSFARISDDIADDIYLTKKTKEEKLNLLEKELENAFTLNPKTLFAKEIKNQSDKHNLEKDFFLEIIKGVKQDLNKNTYENFEELNNYMDKVAVAPGILTLRAINYPIEKEKELSKNLGYAVQLTNILRDVYVDIKMDRFYIPIEELKKFNLTINDFKNDLIDEKKIKLFEDIYFTAKKYYKNANEIMNENFKKDFIFPLLISILYETLLNKIKKNNFNIIKKIPKITLLEKILIFLKIVWRKNA